MRLKTLHIKNYRSIRDQLIVLGKYNCLVGANGAGKSTVLCALNVLFREGGTATDTTTLHIEDFHAKNVADPVEITATFHELSDSAKADLAGYVRNGELVVSAIAEYDVVSASATVKQYGERKVFKPFAEFFKQLNDKALVSPLKTIYVALREAFPELPELSTKDAMTSALRLYEEARPDECELIRSEDQFYGVSKGSSRLSPHIQWVYIPAVKDAADEQSESRNTALGKLLARAVRSKVNFQEQIKRIADAARAEYGKLLQDNQQALDEISASLASRLVQWAHPSPGLAVKWQQDAKKSVQVEEPIAGILAKEGDFEGQLGRFGHGLQRSFLLAILSELAGSGDAGPTLLLGCEEPELYQHPPQARHLANVLRLLSNENAQVLVTTHSPYFVSGQAFEDVRCVRRARGEQHSTVHRLTFDKLSELHQLATGKHRLKPAGTMARMHQALQVSLNEMFFCQRLVLVEGPEDIAYITAWMAASGRWDAYRACGVEVVSAYAKSNLLYPLLIAQGLSIPCLTIFDSDVSLVDQKDLHEVDNVALLRATAGDPSVPFPTETVWGKDHVTWPDNFGATIEAEIDADAWTKANEFASNECGHAKGLAKNTLHVGARLAYLLDNGIRPPSLERLCDVIIKH